MVCSDESNFGENTHAIERDGEMLDMRDWQCNVVEGPVVTTGAPTRSLLGHQVKGRGPIAVGWSDNAQLQDVVEHLACNVKSLWRQVSCPTTNRWACGGDVICDSVFNGSLVVANPILSADFLQHYNLVVDMHSQCLSDARYHHQTDSARNYVLRHHMTQYFRIPCSHSAMFCYRSGMRG